MPFSAMLGLLLAPGAATAPPPPELAAAEAFIDAFYSFEPKRLDAALAAAPGSKTPILYYQGWAEGGNYLVRKRQPCVIEKATEVRCAITVKDDLIAALGTGFDVTDTFHLTFKDGRIVAVRTSSNDPPEMAEGFKRLERERPEILAGPCRDMFKGGTTPQACVRAVVKGFKEFSAPR